MPDDKAQVILRDLVDRHGPFSSSADDLRRCRGFLLDLAGSHKLEINLLLRALESGAPERLAAGRTTLGLVTPRLVRELQETHGISAENAAWSVAAWGFALGLKPAAEQERQRIAAEQERQAAARAEEEKRRQEAAEQDRQRIAADQARQATAARAAEEKRRQEAAEQDRQRIAAEQARQAAARAAEDKRRQEAAEAARRQQSTPIWQKIGIELVQIPAGEFLFGKDKQRVKLDAYAIAKTPVTNRQYKAFVDATGHCAPNHWKGGRIPAGKEDHPVVYVSWEDAMAFCQWAGVALPTEQQWEKAARKTDGRTYPWGNTGPNKHRCNFNKEVGDTTPVGKYPAGANGLFDMAGNVWEWCAENRALRGGSWWSNANSVRCAYHLKYVPSDSSNFYGFRVVSSDLATVARRAAEIRRLEAAEQERQRAIAEAARAAEEKRRQEAAEQERQRIAAEQARQTAARAAEEIRRQAEAARRQLWQQIGIELVQIPAGEFLYGDGKQRIHLDAYAIAKTPITNRQYKAFVDATGYQAPWHWKNGNIPPGKEDHPVVYVSWDDATTFCRWAGLALPGKQQWEKAARGTDGRTYPWGERKPDRNRCNFNQEVKDTTSVDKYPAGASPYGLLDMAGNVWEWCREKWHDEHDRRVVLGGSYLSDTNTVRCTSRFRTNPVYHYDDLGFRVVSPGS